MGEQEPPSAGTGRQGGRLARRAVLGLQRPDVLGVDEGRFVNQDVHRPRGRLEGGTGARVPADDQAAPRPRRPQHLVWVNLSPADDDGHAALELAEERSLRNAERDGFLGVELAGSLGFPQEIAEGRDPMLDRDRRHVPAVHRDLVAAFQLMNEDLEALRIETETHVEDGPTLGLIFEQLGYAPMFRYEKFRTEWSEIALADAYVRTLGHLVIDETPIGTYAELEGPTSWIDATLARLEVDPATCLTDSYGKLFLTWKARTGSAAENLTFDEIEQAVPAMR